ncbi:hypothetical protein ABW19_dt0208751 [Dactylella cylindrospora]|nr:hypothetical protein ABW19_dt0208751 [Dactylella cylindrospora]
MATADTSRCFICGGQFRVAMAPNQPLWSWAWWQDVRFVFNPAIIGPSRNEIPPEMAEDSYPGISSRGKIHHQEAFRAYVMDKAAGIYLWSSLKTMRGERDWDADYDGADDKLGTAMHDDCWNILLGAAKAFRPPGFSEDVQWISTLHEILKYTAWTRNPMKLLWPHKYDGLEEYMQLHTEHPKLLDYTENKPCLPRGQARNHRPWSRLTPGNMTIPAFLPLPLELAQKVISYLNVADLVALEKIEAEKRIEVPEISWKERFNIDSEFGHFTLTSLITDLSVDGSISWHEACLTAVTLESKIPGLRNHRRIWRICRELMDQIYDTIGSARFSMNAQEINEDLEIAPRRNRDPLYQDPSDTRQSFYADTLSGKLDPYQTICVQANFEARYEDHLWRRFSQFEGSITKYLGSLSNIFAEQIAVSFVGSGRMRFVSGLRFLPTNEKIGLINPRDERFLDFTKGRGRVLAFYVAATAYGVVDLSLVEGTHPQWLCGRNPQDAAVTRRLFKGDNAGIKIAEITAGADITKLTKLAISSPDFVPETELSSTEQFIQQRLWPPISLLGDTPILNTANYASSPSCFLPEQFRPMFILDFSDSPVCRITAWSKSSEPSALAFLQEGKDKALTLGRPRGSALDFVVHGNRGERIVAMEVVSKPLLGLEWLAVRCPWIHTGYNLNARASLNP